MKVATKIHTLFIALLVQLSVLCQNTDVPGYSFGLSWSGLQYSVNAQQNQQGQNTLPFKGLMLDDNKRPVSGEFKTEKKGICPGFMAQWEFFLFTGKKKKIYQGPTVFVSYQKNEDFGSDMWAFGYFVRYKPKATSPTGLSLAVNFFPQHRFKRELTNVSTTDSSTFYFNGENFGDTVKMSYAEKKMSLCPQLNLHLKINRKFELRFCAGYFITLKSVSELKIDSELNEFKVKSRGGLFTGDGTMFARQPVFAPGMLFLNGGLYMHILSNKQKKK